MLNEVSPMGTITGALMSFFDLVEAEGRTLREKTIIVIEGILIMCFGVLLIFVGAIAAGCALYMLLRCYIGGPAAAGVVAVLLAVPGFLILSKGRSTSRNGGGPVE